MQADERRRGGVGSKDERSGRVGASARAPDEPQNELRDVPCSLDTRSTMSRRRFSFFDSVGSAVPYASYSWIGCSNGGESRRGGQLVGPPLSDILGDWVRGRE